MLASQNCSSIPALRTSCQSALVQPPFQKQPCTPIPTSPSVHLALLPRARPPTNQPASPTATTDLPHPATGVSLFVHIDRTWDKYGFTAVLSFNFSAKNEESLCTSVCAVRVADSHIGALRLCANKISLESTEFFFYDIASLLFLP